MQHTATVSQRSWSIPGWLPAVILLLVTIAIGPSLGSLSRPLFVLACGAAGWYAWRCGAAAHLQTAIILFTFAPMARRIVDLSVGYDDSSLMLVGPLFALLAPVPQLRRLLEGNQSLGAQSTPMLIVAGCILYTTMLTVFQGEWMQAASGVLKWGVPMLYAAAIGLSADRDEMVQAAASAFVVILPITGVIGLVQYVDPQPWDRYWMQFAPIMSAGQPIPFGVRTFSSMNGPASFATFTAVGLLLVCFLRPRAYVLLLAIPAALAFFLSLYRTAWMMLALGIVFCLMFATTRVRAGVILLGLVAAVVIAAVATPFGEVIADRLGTLTEVSGDDSAEERLDQFLMLWNMPDSSLFGSGFTTSDVGTAGTMAIDGMIIACWLMMGMVVGMICLSALVWTAVNAIGAAWRDPRPEAIMVGALGCTALLQLPLANLTAGEFGFLFWTFAVLATLPPRANAQHGVP
ncbi:MAG TPA: O-antigen ligase domain-containing protein [Xanthobacteraceae bacterium]|nr:O-antigen ligase domain-containing protein [Xanthobacteraceae bacterium]